MTNDKKAPLWWMLECPKYGEPCYCKEECMYLRQKSLREQKEIVEQDIRFLLSELERLGQERDKLIEVLRWYADAVNYEYRTSYLDQDAPIIDDNGQRARDILKEIGVTDV